MFEIQDFSLASFLHLPVTNSILFGISTIPEEKFSFVTFAKKEGFTNQKQRKNSQYIVQNLCEIMNWCEKL